MRTHLVLSTLLLASLATAGPIEVTPHLLFDGTVGNDNVAGPRLASESGFPYAVFQVRGVGPFGVGPGLVVLQELRADGEPIGPARWIDATTSAGLPDASGEFVVFARPDVGDVALFQKTILQTFSGTLAGSPGALEQARISGSDVVAGSDVGFVLADNIFGAFVPAVVRGPVPFSEGPEIDAGLMVWQERVSGLEAAVRAQEIGGGSFFVFSGNLADGFDEVDPAVWREQVAFGLIDTSTGLGDIVLRDIGADTTRTYSLGFAGLGELALTRDFLGFEADDANGVQQAYLMRLSDGELLQLTQGPLGGGDVDVFGDLVTYVSGQQAFVGQIGEGAQPVPEPGTLVLCGFAAAGFWLRRRRS